MTTSGSDHPLPDREFVRRHPAHFIAFGGGAGLSPVAPGTAGTLAAFPLFWLFDYFLDPVEFLLLIGVLFIIGIWACRVTGRALGNHDHGGMVWDEIIAFLLRYYDNALRGGFGVMFDDLLAAFMTLLCLAAWKAFVIPSGIL